MVRRQSSLPVGEGRQQVTSLDDSVTPEHARGLMAADPHSDLFTNTSAHKIGDCTPSQIVKQKPGLTYRLCCLLPRFARVHGVGEAVIPPEKSPWQREPCVMSRAWSGRVRHRAG